MEGHCYLRFAHDMMADCKIAHDKRFCATFDEPVIPFGAISSKDASRLLIGSLMCHVFRAGGEVR